MGLRILAFYLLTICIFGCASTSKSAYSSGVASWYGKRFQGKKTASGEPYNMNAMTAAHPKLPFGTKVKVVSKSNGRSVVVRINDRGPFAKNRIIDLSKSAAKKLNMITQGEMAVILYIMK